MFRGKRILINPIDDYKGDIFIMEVIRLGTLSEKAGFVEYKMPEKMVKAYLDSRKDSEKKRSIQEFLVNIVNQEFGLKGHCVKVIPY